MGHERAGERTAVARLEDRRLDLDEPPLVERAADRRDDPGSCEERLARLLVHQQVEVPLAVAELDVGQAVERVRERLRVAREHLDALGEHGRLAAPRLPWAPDDADDVAEVDVELARHRGVADHLDPPGAVDEVEEDELPHLATCHRATGDTPRRAGVAARCERLRLRPHRGDLVPVGEALRRRHRRDRTHPLDPERSVPAWARATGPRQRDRGRAGDRATTPPRRSAP